MLILPGPLLWHFENNTTNDPSVELDLEEVKQLARDIGFELSVSIHILLTLYYLIIFVRYRKKEPSKQLIPVMHRVCSAMCIMPSSGWRRRRFRLVCWHPEPSIICTKMNHFFGRRLRLM
jgi:hypothetical protein